MEIILFNSKQRVLAILKFSFIKYGRSNHRKGCGSADNDGFGRSSFLSVAEAPSGRLAESKAGTSRICGSCSSNSKPCAGTARLAVA